MCVCTPMHVPPYPLVYTCARVCSACACTHREPLEGGMTLEKAGVFHTRAQNTDAPVQGRRLRPAASAAPRRAATTSFQLRGPPLNSPL